MNDRRSKYTSSLSTDVAATWKRFGFKPTTAAERLARQRRTRVSATVAAAGASVTKLDTAKRRAHASLDMVRKRVAE
jgi:hypothetical protein